MLVHTSTQVLCTLDDKCGELVFRYYTKLTLYGETVATSSNGLGVYAYTKDNG